MAGDDIGYKWFPRKYRLKHRYKMVEGKILVIRVKRRLIPSSAEVDAAKIKRMGLILISAIGVFPKMMSVVKLLKQPMHVNRPGDFGADIRFNNAGGILGMIERCKIITKVME